MLSHGHCSQDDIRLHIQYALLTAVINNIKESLLAISLPFTPEWELCHSAGGIRTAGHDGVVLLVQHHNKHNASAKYKVIFMKYLCIIW